MRGTRTILLPRSSFLGQAALVIIPQPSRRENSVDTLGEGVSRSPMCRLVLSNSSDRTAGKMR